MTDVAEPGWRADASTQSPFGDNPFNVENAVKGLSNNSAAAPIGAAADQAAKIKDLADWPALITLVDQIVTSAGDIMNAAENFEESDRIRMENPLGWLTGTLVDFVINLCQPLEDLLGMVTGNEGRMKTSAEMWLTVIEGARQNGAYIADNGTAALEGWEGEAADAARHRIGEIGRGLQIMGAFGAGLAVALRAFAILAKKLTDKVKEFLGELAERAITTWLPGMASGLATFGASTAATVALAVATVAGYIMTAISLIKLAISIFGMIPGVVDLIKDGLSGLGDAFGAFG
ncbi:hypothetical protein [Glycomyces buryatensis]|uniref:WXG100 family type VII secretion target n=1 Tax=Glycomyces buryatensis TaxID=2570927 RepID=A0A4V4HQM2_9ACTN|nr:hypothetical protein [Glycomyces buryatensis]THV34376.1 hypothetical protein FAB82_24285 [Glycomyces buryatensis]